MSTYIDYLHDVLRDDLTSGRRVYPGAQCAAVTAFIERSGAEDMVPDLMLALMDRIDLMAEEVRRERIRNDGLRENVQRLISRNYQLERRLEAQRTGRIVA